MTDEEAFSGFYERARPRVYRALVAAVGDRQLAAEATDEAFLRCWSRWSTVRGYRDPAGWVFRVAANWATSWRRKMKLRPTVAAADLDRPSVDEVPDHQVWSALGALPFKARRDVLLRFYLDFTPTEIAELVGEPVGTVKARIHRAVRSLAANQEVSV